MEDSKIDTSLFQSSWEDATEQFRRLAEAAGGRVETRFLTNAETGNTYSLESGEELCLDFAVWSTCENESRPERVFLLTAGIHGVEGYTGSAIQAQILKEGNLLENLPKNSKLIMVHVLNPYGMAHLRRVNENNIDLNRNFLTPQEFQTRSESTNPLYVKHYNFLNPAKPVGFFQHYFKLVFMLITDGFSNLKQALGGNSNIVR